MQDIWNYIASHEVIWGIALGLLVAAFIWKSGLTARLTLKKEVRRLQDDLRDLQSHLNTQLKINAAGNDKVTREMDELRTQNENLRVNIANLQAKPGRQEARQLQLMEAAIRSMQESAPGFAPAWEQAIRRAEADYEAGESGLKKLIRRVMPGIGTSAPAHDDAENVEMVDFEKTKGA